MRLTKKIIALACCTLILPTLFIGCSKGSILDSKNKATLESNKGTLKEVSMYYDRDTAKKDTLKGELEKMSKDKELLGDSKALVVKFYEYEDEIYFTDTIPYAVAYWGPEVGAKESYDLVSTKNNEYFVELNAEKEVGITDEDTEIYEEVLNKLKTENNLKTSLREQYLFNLSLIEEIEAGKEKVEEVIDKYTQRFDDYATYDVLNGNLEK